MASRPQAVARIEQGQVLVSGTVADKPSRMVSPAEPIELLGPPPRFVSRGGEKLDAALQRFAIEVTGRRALDAGASTGGFTDCLLQAGAASVVAVDVGRGQLHPRLRSDPRVDCRERLDIRDVTLDTLGGSPVDLVTADLSFISATRAVPGAGRASRWRPARRWWSWSSPSSKPVGWRRPGAGGSSETPTSTGGRSLEVTGALIAARSGHHGGDALAHHGVRRQSSSFWSMPAPPSSGPAAAGPADPAATAGELVDRAVTEAHAEIGPG